MSTPREHQNTATAAEDYVREGWDAALAELRQHAADLEARGAVRAAVTLYDAIRIVRLHGPNKHQLTNR